MDIDVAHIGDEPLRHLLHEVFPPRFRVVIATAVAGEAQGMLAQGPRPESAARQEGGTLVKGYAENSNGGVELADVLDDA